jgi:hypothetical protein
LIYIKGGSSSRSPWVAFERDYALRSGKRVYSYDGSGLALDDSPPLDLPVFTIYGGQDRRTVLKVLSFLRKKRSFDLFIRDEAGLVAESWQVTVAAAAERIIVGEGGFAVWFVPTEWRDAGDDAAVDRWNVEWLFRQGHSERILPVRLSDVELATLAEEWKLTDGGGLRDRAIDLFRRRSHFGPGLVLTLFSGLPITINQNSLDDLIVRLYYMIYNTANSPAADALRGPTV